MNLTGDGITDEHLVVAHALEFTFVGVVTISLDPQKAGTVEHYERMFEGRTAEDVVRFLEERGFHVFYYENPAEIGILLERLVTFFYYRVKINFAFEGGVFESARIGAHGVK